MPDPSLHRSAWRHLLVALLIPVFLGGGMALAYLGGFHRATPHHVHVELAGPPAVTAPLVAGLSARLASQFEVSAVPAAQAAADVSAGRVTAAYEPAGHPVLLVNSAASPTTSQAATELFTTVAATTEQTLLQVRDLGPLPANDALGQNLFFLLVALSVGGYSGAVAIGAAGAGLRPLVRSGVAVGLALVIAVLGVAVAGPLYGALHGHLLALGGIAWLYVCGIMLIGVGLHPLLGRFTTPVLVGLFVMLNFTTSGGVFDPSLQSPFFQALSHVWNGDGFMAAGRGLLYRNGTGLATSLVRLGIWAAAGIALVAVSALRHPEHTTESPEPAAAPSADAGEELEEVIAA